MCSILCIQGDCNNSECRCLLLLEFRDKFVGKMVRFKEELFFTWVKKTGVLPIGCLFQLDH